MNALVVDDERLARSELKRLLAAVPAVTVVGEAANPAEARKLIASLQPDLVFLDIQMPGGTGLDLLESLEPPVPHVIFTTAHDEFAVKAFELNAVDYLLKPIEPARLAQAVARLAERSPAMERPETEAEAAEPAPTGRLTPGARVFVREGDRCWFVDVAQIRLMESEGNYTRVHFGTENPLLFRSLNAMEERLDPAVFFRANRQQIVNLRWIEKIEPWFSGGLALDLKGGGRVEISRRKALEFRTRLSL